MEIGNKMPLISLSFKSPNLLFLHFIRKMRPLLVTCVLLAAASLCAYAQERVTDGDVTVVFPPRLRSQADAALALYRQAAQQVRMKTDLPDPGPVRIELADTDLAFQAAYRRLGGRGTPEHALAVAFSPQNVVLVRSSHLAGIGPGSLPETLVHETFHLYLATMLRRVNRRVPLWFNEGVAQWVAGQKVSPQIRNMLQTDAKGGRLPSLASLSERFPDERLALSIAYARSLSFVEWLEGRSPGTVRGILSAMAQGERFKVALLDTTGENVSALEAAHVAKLAGERSFLRTFLSQLTLFSVLALIALAAFARYLVKRKRLHRTLEYEDTLDGYED